MGQEGAVAFTYDLFISYASSDRAWVERLYNDLLVRNRSLRIFWDRNSIPAGTEWRKELDAALDGSHHIVSIWSEAAKASNEVGPEIEHFEQRKKQYPQGPQINFYIPLEGSRGPQEELQGFPDIRTLALYKKNASPDDVTTILAERKAEASWSRTVTQILKSVDDAEPGDPFWVIVLSMTKNQALKLTPASRRPKLPPLETVLKHFNLTVAQLQDRYGDTVWDWKPYGDKPVEHMLDDLQVGVNRKIIRPIRWKKDDVLFDDRRTLEAKVQDLTDIYGKKPALLILDPFALYESDVKDLYDFLAEAFENSRLVVVSLSPDGGANYPLWDYLRDGGHPYLRAFYDPPTNEAQMPLFGLNLREFEEIQRLVRLSVNKRVSLTAQTALNLVQP